VQPVGGTIAGPASQPEPGRREAAPPPAAQGRALVKVSRPPRADTHHLPGAGFLAQLIACDQKMAQTRERRRAEPQEAAAAYANALAAVPLDRTLSRSA
jgi:hypothetical protein